METIHIALSFDDNYIEPAIVLMTSILLNKSNEKIHFHILDGGLSNENKKLIFDFSNCKVTFHLVNTNFFDYQHNTSTYQLCKLFPLIITNLVHVDKLIYLDSDTIVRTSLKELWDIEIEGNYIAAVEDVNSTTKTKIFNSGMMVINCKKWVEHEITKRSLKYLKENENSKSSCTQNVLNKFFEGKVKFLDLKWNLQYSPINIWPNFEDRSEYQSAIENPNIIHYLGDFKPWLKGFGCLNPKQKEYFKYHKLTCYSLKDYSKWEYEDKFHAYKGICRFLKRFPLFFLRKQFWRHVIISFCL